MKVVGVGYPRTGTKTLGECFRLLGFRNATWNGPMYEFYESGNLDPLWDYAARYESFDDLPWCMLYKEFDRKFPGSRFILTVRQNEFDWFDSFRKHAVRLDAGNFLSSVGADFANTIDIYRRHNAGVRDYFKGRDDMLEICWDTGATWDSLALFLGKPVPSGPLPHKNKTPRQSTFQLYRIYLNNLLRGQAESSDPDELKSTLLELARSLPNLSGEEQRELLDSIEQSPVAREILSQAGVARNIVKEA